jgi:hypothetical protein
VADTLAALWLAEPRWVPAALVHVHRLDPGRCAAVLAALPEPVARDLLRAVVAEHLPDLPAPLSAPLPTPLSAPGTRPEARAAAPDPDRAASSTDAGTDTTATKPATSTARAAGPPPRPPTTAEVLLEVALVLHERPAQARTERFAAWLAAPDAPRAPATPQVPVAAIGPEPEATPEPAPTPADGGRPSRIAPLRRTPEPAPLATAPEGAWRHRPWEASGPAVPTRLASLLYAVNLVERFELGRLAGESTQWAVVEALGRRLLHDLPAGRRRTLLTDPLFGLLAELDTRPPDVPNPVRLGAAVRPVRRFLRDHRLDATTFTRPGSVLVSRTHVDVVLALSEIDIDARLAGLDRDPGWVPGLGRIVLFHFDERDGPGGPGTWPGSGSAP